MKRLICIVAFLATVTGLSNLVWAYSLVPSPRVCTEFFRADLVISAKVTGETIVYGPNDTGGEVIYSIDSIKEYRGNSSGLGQLRTMLNSGRAILDVGQSYLLFAKHWKSEVFPDEEGYYIGGGGNSAPLSESTNTIAQIWKMIGNHRTATTGNIRGFVKVYKVRQLEGLLFTATSGHAQFSAKADTKGWFEFDVPPGVYQIESEASQDLTMFDLSYDDPHRLEVKAGECSEVAFVDWRN